MIVICDYDAGNLHSVQNAISYLGYDSVASSDPKTIRAASKVIMPGVGSFGDARRKLDAYGLSGTLRISLPPIRRF